jgi:uncharacterized protein
MDEHREESGSTRSRSKRGFGSMDPDKHREIARKGGLTAHAKGKGHTFTSEEARAAGRKGGATTSQNREHMKSLGQRGGVARAAKMREKKPDDGGTLPPA